jgi:hypothetical protein
MEFVSRSVRQLLWLWHGGLSHLAKQSISQMEFQCGDESCVGQFVQVTDQKGSFVFVLKRVFLLSPPLIRTPCIKNL